MFLFPHGATVDRDGNLWLTDARGDKGKGNQVFKFSPDGKVLLTLGKAGMSGSGPDLFDQPTDVVVAPNGDIFVTDSHRNGTNNRVVKFTKDGKYVKEWGRKGSGRGEMSEPHTIAMDSRGRLFVGDRENNRIQIFDQDGNYLDEWRQFGRPSGIYITADDTIYVARWVGHRLHRRHGIGPPGPLGRRRRGRRSCRQRLWRRRQTSDARAACQEMKIQPRTL
jgi:DNA-binding beta-propeller fold protein YncE